MNDIKRSVDIVSSPWIGSSYYETAGEWTFVFWDQHTVFNTLFKKLNLESVLELAVGFGRHAEKSHQLCGTLILMDVLDQNIEKCSGRFASIPNISIIKNNGFDYRPVADSSLTAIYCYDAMVHFSPDIVRSYLNDTYRVLRPGGRALFHHSNFAAPQDRHYGLNPHARNHMTKSLFESYSVAAGLRVVESVVIDWSDAKDLDCVTLVEKP